MENRSVINAGAVNNYSEDAILESFRNVKDVLSWVQSDTGWM